MPELLGRPPEGLLSKDSVGAGLIVVPREHPGLNLAKAGPRVQAVYV